MINASSKTLEELLKTYKIMQEFKAQGGTKRDAKITKKQVKKGNCKASDTEAVGPIGSKP
jgi:hypothetical protein